MDHVQMLFKTYWTAFQKVPISIQTLKTFYDRLDEKITAAIRRNEMAPAPCHTSFCLSRAAGEAACPLDRIGHEPHPLSNFELSITTLSVLRLITKVV